jgi:multidrug efflux pump subunit AcrB
VITFFARHPTAANLLMAAVLVIGAFSYPALQRETFPKFAPDKVRATVAWPGSRPEEVEEAICRRIEDAIETVNHVAEIVCEAREGVASATIEKTSAVDLDRFTADVTSAVDAIGDFPENVENPVVAQLGLTDFVASIAVTGPEDRVHLKAYADEIRDRMLQWGGIPSVDVQGFSSSEFRIALSRDRLHAYGVSVADVARAIQQESLDLPSGSLETSDREFLIRYSGERRSADAFRDIVVISSANGGQVRLRSLAQIEQRFTLDEARVEFNGKPAAILAVTKTVQQDTLDVFGSLGAFLDDARATAPPGVSITVTNDVSSIVSDRLNLLIRNAAQGLILVFLMLWLFFGLRYSLWVAASLPVSFAGAFFFMVLVGYSINMLTMVGLLIVIGILMDDAIVIAENIASHRARGKSSVDAVVDGAKQVLPSVFASFATTACIFGSLGFLQGEIGQVLRVVPVVMLFVLIVSLIEAFLILPHHLKQTLSAQEGVGGRVQAYTNGMLEAVQVRFVVPLANLAVAWRYLTMGLALSVLILTVGALASGVVKFSPFPDIDGNVIEARIMMPPGTPLQRTQDAVHRVSQALDTVSMKLSAQERDGEQLVRNVTFRYNYNQDAGETGAHVATVIADLLDSETRQARIDDILLQWKQEVGSIPDVVTLNFTEGTFGPGGRAIDIRLSGTDLEELSTAANELGDWLLRYRGVYNVMTDLRPGKPELRITLREGAAALGLSGRNIADQIRAAFYGYKVDEIQTGSQGLEINVLLDSDSRDSLADVDEFTITAADGSQVPLTAVAHVSDARGYSRIRRVDRRRTVSVQGELDSQLGNSTEIVAETRQQFIPELLERYPSVSADFGGAGADADRTLSSMLRGFALGIIGIYLLLSFQFRSYLEPLIVMVIIPFALIGAIGGHLLLGLDFTMPSTLGFLALAGIVVNNSILLVAFTKNSYRETGSIAEAAPLAAGARFRAIMLTSLTTIAGLLPLLTEQSLQAQVLIPLVASLAFGLMATTILVLFIVPAAYAILADFGGAKLERKLGASNTVLSRQPSRGIGQIRL